MAKTRLLFSLRLAMTGVLLAGVVGCSREAKKSGHLRKADEYFKAGEYEKAEIEYKNVRQLEALNPEAIARLGMIYFDQGRVTQGPAYLRKAFELQPENLDVRLKVGYINLASGKPAEARGDAMIILQRRPTDPLAPILLAESVTQTKEAEEVRAVLEKLPSPQSAPVLTALGIIRTRERNFKEAETLLTRALAADPKFAAAHATLANVYLNQKDVARAEKSLAAAVDLSPRRSPFRLQLAMFNLQTGKSDVAKQAAEEMLREVPDYLPGYILRAKIAIAEKKYDESIALLEKVSAREPLHLEAMQLAAQTRMAKGETDQAIAILQRAVQAYPAAAPFHFQLGAAYLAKEDLDNAGASLAEAVKHAPKSPQAILALAQVNIRKRNFLPAISSLQDFLKQNPGSAEANLLLASAYRSQGNLDGALGIYRLLATANPKNGQMELLIGGVLLQQNKKDEARQAYGRAVELSPDLILAWEQLVNLDVSEKKFAAAESRLAAVITKEPANAAFQLLLAKVYLSQGNNEKAEGALQKVIDLKPESPAPYILLSQLYLSTKQADKALSILQSVVAKDPNNFSSLLLLGGLQEQKKDFPAARASYEKAVAINPKHAPGLNNLAYLLAEQFGELDKALEYAQKARDLTPSQAETADTVGWILYRKQQYARAIALLEDSAEKLPQNAEAQYHLGMTRYMLGDEDGARTALERALQLNGTFGGAGEARDRLAILSIDTAKVGDDVRKRLNEAIERRKDDPVVLSRLGRLYEKEGNVEKAVGAYETVLKSNPANANAALNAIRLYRARNETSKAFELAKTTRKFAPSDGRIAHVLGRMALENREYQYSTGVLRDAARLLPGDPEVAFDLGEASYSLGQVATAESAFSEALAANASFSRAGKAREYVELIGFAENPEKAAGAANRVEVALRADGGNVPALIAKGTIDQRKGDVKAAKQAYEKALARLPEFVPAKRNLAILYAAHPEDDKKAFDLASKARQAYPNDADVAKALGIIEFRQGNHNRALVLLQESARTLTADSEVMFYVGMSQRHLKNEVLGNGSLKRALELGGLPEQLARDAQKALGAKAK